MSETVLRGLEDGRKPSLVISECQSAIIDPAVAMFSGLGKQVLVRSVISRIAALAELCRGRGIPVIYTTIRLQPAARAFVSCSALQGAMRRNPLLRSDRAESEIHPDLAPQRGDLVCQRMHGVSAFHGTELESMLRGLAVHTVLLTGVSTHVALVGTAIEAINRGFPVVLPEDCTAGGSAEVHEFVVQHIFPLLATITRSDQLGERLKRLKF